MADDTTPSAPYGDRLPDDQEPDADRVSEPEPDSTPNDEPAAEPEAPRDASAPAEPEPEPEAPRWSFADVNPVTPAADEPVEDSGSTSPHDFSAEAAAAGLAGAAAFGAGESTGLVPDEPESAFFAEEGARAPFPEFDPQAGQHTQLIPQVGSPVGAAAAPPIAPAAPVAPPEVAPTVISGSRVIMVVSRGPSPIPAAAVTGTPEVVGLSQGDALAKLQEAGLSAQVFNEYSELPRGEVTGQLPPFGRDITAGSEAVLLVSGGPSPTVTIPVPLPDVVGMNEADAVLKLQAATLIPQVVRDYSPNVPAGLVVEQLPSGHKSVEAPRKKRSLWWLWLLLGLAVLVALGGGLYYYLNRTATVPNLVGLPQAQAGKAITAAGFGVGSISTTQTLSASEVGNVTTQSPAPNTQWKLVNRINITVSGGQKLFAVPNVTGKPEADARSELTSAGLQVSVSQSYSTSVPKGNVVTQTPIPGEKVPTATTVGITVSLGIQSVQVPSVIALTQAAAANALKAANLSSQALTIYTPAYTSTVGQSFAQYPAANTPIPPGTIVGFMVSKGPPSSGATATVIVPSVVGLSEKAANTALKKVKLSGSNVIVKWSATGRPAGEVVGQCPIVGQSLLVGSRMILFVSNGQP